MSKYNAKKVEFDGIKFDSGMEAEYYKHLKQQKDMGAVKDFSLQPEYELQPKFVNPVGKKIFAIKYKADFLVHFPDGTEQVIDVKGMETPDFKLKKKMFEYKYEKELVCVTKAPKYLHPVEWVRLDELVKIRRERKKRGNGKK